jgi:hypothetical protein
MITFHGNETKYCCTQLKLGLASLLTEQLKSAASMLLSRILENRQLSTKKETEAEFLINASGLLFHLL